MPSQFFHGVQVVEVESAAQTVQTLASSVIGVVGTAPNAQAVASATLAVGTVGANNGITLTATTPGAAGNQISLQVRIPNSINQTLSIQVNGSAITAFLATGGVAGTTTTTAAELITALAASVPAAALVTAAATGASNGSGLAVATALAYLAGGVNAIAPLNTPVVINSASQIGLFGTSGTLFKALNAIFDQAQATVVVVRVAQNNASDTDPTTILNVIGTAAGGAFTGLQALLGAEAQTGAHPRLIVAPGFSSTLSVAQQMLATATALRAVAIVDGPSTNNSDAFNYALNFGDARVYLVDPGVQIVDKTTGLTVSDPASGRVAGLIVANDANNGFWTSPSNQVLQNVVGLARTVDFSFSNPNSSANLLNAANIATIIRQSGFRLWGNRTTSIDPNFAFLSVRRTADLIEDSLQRAYFSAVDKNITNAFFQEIISGVQGYLDMLKAEGAILDGTITKDPNLNTAAAIQAGQAYFNITFTPPTPGEDITFTVNPVATTGYASLVSSSTTS